jgi:hypothetical protein
VFPLDRFGGVVKCRLDVTLPQTRLILEDLFMGPAVRQKLYDELHGNSRPLYDRLADQDFRVYNDAIMPSRRFSPFPNVFVAPLDS